MTATALSFDHVSKHYRGAYEYRTLRDELAAGARRILGRPARARRAIKALDDLSLTIPAGQSFALIGDNGVGKTTALKLASRITYPTTGRIRVRGRVGALIEVGTGMHPELTGRENVSLYGRILGLSRREIVDRFDEIVEFAGIGGAIDQPVKQYSSGMQLRLGFSVATHLEPDVLLVDEALAVGDTGFQYRCVERMRELVREGRTLVFVSHDMSAVETVCERAVLLRAGRVAYEGTGRDVVSAYVRAVEAELLANASDGFVDGTKLEITRVTLHNRLGFDVSEIAGGEPLTVRIHYRTLEPVRRPIFTVGLIDPRLGLITLASMLIDGQVPQMLIGEGHLDCAFTGLPLRPRVYDLWGEVRGEAGFGLLINWQRLRRFQVTGETHQPGKGAVGHSTLWAPVTIPYEWKLVTRLPGAETAGAMARGERVGGSA